VWGALDAKLGASISSVQDRSGIFVLWDNGASIARLQQHSCTSKDFLVGPMEGWIDEINFLLKAYKCPNQGILTYQESSVIYLHKVLGATAPERLQATIKERAAKARSDL
jgi:hypothetical protein